MRILKLSVGSLALLLSLTAGSAAQTWDTLWTQTYWNGWFDSLNWMEETSDHGFILVGNDRAEGRLDDDIYLIKTDCVGGVEWSQTIGDEHYENGLHVLQSDDGGYLISGTSDLTGSPGGGGVWIVKTDALGDTLWTYPFCPEDRSAYPTYAIQTFDGSYAITGLINLSGQFNDAFVLVLDRDGGLVDYHHYGDSFYQDAWFLTQMPDSGFMFTGHWDDHYGGLYDWWLVRLNKDLDIMWDSTYALTGYYDEIHSSCRADDGIVMVGEAAGVGHILKANFDGQTQWSKPMSVTPYAEGYDAICTTVDGGYMAGGFYNVTTHRRDFAFVRLDAAGDTLWTYAVGGSEDDHGQSLVQTFDGNFVLGGSSMSWVNGECMWLVKIGLPCCEGRVGDANGLGGDEPTLGDIAYMIDALFITNSTCVLPCLAEADVNQSGGMEPTGADITIGDISILIDYLYITGPTLGLPDCL